MIKRFLVLGAGAIGSYLGGFLALNGHDVLFLEKEDSITALQNQGIVMEIKGKISTLSSPEFTSSLDLALNKELDLIILAVKTYHLGTILPDLLRLHEKLPPLLCLQNGVESEKRLAKALGSDLIIPGTVTSAVDCPGKGKVILQKKRGMGIADNHPISRDLVEIFMEAGISCKLYPSAESMKWSKLITNLLGNASSAILDMTPTQIYSDPDLYRIELDQVREALEVMDIQGIKVVNLPGVPVKILAAIIKYVPDRLSQPFLSSMIGSGRGKKMPSFHNDLYSGRDQSEVDQLNGAVVRAGIEYLISTPVNTFLTNTLISLINKELPLETYNLGQEKYISQIAASKKGINSTKNIS